MRCSGRVLLSLVVMASSCGQAWPAAPETRALGFLAGEVPRWFDANKCYSCHNNGDAARALYAARRLGVHVDTKALEGTTAWLAQPERWSRNGGDGAYNDRVLM